jgi:hypothetical protein
MRPYWKRYCATDDFESAGREELLLAVAVVAMALALATGTIVFLI